MTPTQKTKRSSTAKRIFILIAVLLAVWFILGNAKKWNIPGIKEIPTKVISTIIYFIEVIVIILVAVLAFLLAGLFAGLLGIILGIIGVLSLIGAAYRIWKWFTPGESVPLNERPVRDLTPSQREQRAEQYERDNPPVESNDDILFS